MDRGTILAAGLLALAACPTPADGWSLAVGISGSEGDSLSRQILSTTVRKDLEFGPWTVSPLLSWDLGREQPPDSIWNQLYPELSIERTLGERASVQADGWIAPLAESMDGGGSLEAEGWIDPAPWARISGRLGGGWSASAQARAWSGLGMRWSPAEWFRWNLDASVEYGQPSLSTSGGGKSAGMYVPVFALGSGIDWIRGPFLAGPDFRWSWYSYERSSGSGKGTGRMSGGSMSGSHDDWTLGGHLGWTAGDRLELAATASWTWADDRSSTSVASGSDRGAGRMGTSPADNAAVPTGLSWGIDSRWSW